MFGRTVAVLFALVGVLLAASAQTVVVDTMRAVQPWGAWTTYTFLWVKVLEDQAATDSINRSLMIDFLGVDPHTSEENPLFALWGEDTTSGVARISHFRWNCMRTTPGVLTIELSGEFCGAHCEGFLMHYLYDLRTGGSLKQDRIFTDEGLRAVNDSLARSWRRTITDQIRALEDPRQRMGQSATSVEAMNEAVEMYRVCLESRAEGTPYVEDMVLLPDGLRFTIPRCSAHVNQEMDVLDPLHIDLPRGWLLGLLQPDVVTAFGW